MKPAVFSVACVLLMLPFALLYGGHLLWDLAEHRWQTWWIAEGLDKDPYKPAPEGGRRENQR